jgi:hypothetical protein
MFGDQISHGSWPAYSSYLMPCDFYLWRKLKNAHTKEELKEKHIKINYGNSSERSF